MPGKESAAARVPFFSYHVVTEIQVSELAGVTLHSYRYARAQRAKVAGYPERFAQLALGHNSKAVHRAYAKNAQVKLPPLEEYERDFEQKVV